MFSCTSVQSDSEEENLDTTLQPQTPVVEQLIPDLRPPTSYSPVVPPRVRFNTDRATRSRRGLNDTSTREVFDRLETVLKQNRKDNRKQVRATSAPPRELDLNNPPSYPPPAAPSSSSTPHTVRHSHPAGMAFTLENLSDSIASALIGADRQKTKRVSPRDLPSFKGKSYEDVQDFLLKYERTGRANNWDDDELKLNLNLALDGSALRYHELLEPSLSWDRMKSQLVKAFGKDRIDYDIANFDHKHIANEDPMGYITQTLRMIEVTLPGAKENEKVFRLIEGLPTDLKAKFIRDQPTTLEGFTKRFKEIQQENAYLQKATLENLVKAATLSGQLPLNNIGSKLFQSSQDIFAAATGKATTQAFGVLSVAEENKLLQEIMALKEQVKKLENQNQGDRSAPRTYNNNPEHPPRNNTGYRPNHQRTSDGRPICSRCGKAGHIMRVCRTGRPFSYQQPARYAPQLPAPATVQQLQNRSGLQALPQPVYYVQQPAMKTDGSNQMVPWVPVTQHLN
jgi:hypothetical protein